jgi:threonine/homoserine/homoserine lactone efflux protein
MSGSFLVFLGISVLVIVTPGPDTALTIRNTLIGGRVGGISTALGVSTGQLIWALATSAGVVAILLASENVFQAVKLAGAAYLVFLGAQALIAAFRSESWKTLGANEGVKKRLGAVTAFRHGVISNLGNPKMAVFFASVLPQFAPQGQGMLSALVLLGLVFSTLTFVWLSLYATALSAAGSLLRRPRVRRWLAGVTGTVLIALGLRLATEQR